jgi:hypothetical protein
MLILGRSSTYSIVSSGNPIKNMKEERETLSCTIGGIKQEVTVSGDMNLITRGLFRKMREEKLSYYSAQLQSVEVNGRKFCGSFITNVKLNGVGTLTQFYVIDNESKKDPIICEAAAKSLKKHGKA